MSTKSTPDEIRRRFDRDVERFSNLETGQSATVDAPLVLDLIAEAAASTTPHARAVLDVGCGAGNYTLKLLEHFPRLDATLVDLSPPMLGRAAERVGAAAKGTVTTVQGDIRDLSLPDGGFDIILAAAVLHHLRGDDEWEAVFAGFHRRLRPGGSVWVSDLVSHANPAVQGAHVATLRRVPLNPQRRWRRGRCVPRRRLRLHRPRRHAAPLGYQLDLLRRCGFGQVEVLHKNGCFAAYGAVKPGVF